MQNRTTFDLSGLTPPAILTAVLTLMTALYHAAANQFGTLFMTLSPTGGLAVIVPPQDKRIAKRLKKLARDTETEDVFTKGLQIRRIYALTTGVVVSYRAINVDTSYVDTVLRLIMKPLQFVAIALNRPIALTFIDNVVDTSEVQVSAYVDTDNGMQLVDFGSDKKITAVALNHLPNGHTLLAFGVTQTFEDGGKPTIHYTSYAKPATFALYGNQKVYEYAVASLDIDDNGTAFALINDNDGTSALYANPFANNDNWIDGKYWTGLDIELKHATRIVCHPNGDILISLAPAVNNVDSKFVLLQYNVTDGKKLYNVLRFDVNDSAGKFLGTIRQQDTTKLVFVGNAIDKPQIIDMPSIDFGAPILTETIPAPVVAPVAG